MISDAKLCSETDIITISTIDSFYGSIDALYIAT